MEALKVNVGDCLYMPRNYWGGATILKVVGLATSDGSCLHCEQWYRPEPLGKFFIPDKRPVEWRTVEIEGLESRGHLEKLEPAEVPPEVR